ncbi:MAG: DUF3460 family protein [Nitrosomonas sp.]|nr:DUF3460 family protein [Nitrosomonas sp.]
MWWDKDVDREALKRFEEAKVPQKSYVYFSWPDQEQETEKQKTEK